MMDITPHSPKYRPLIWSDEVLALQERLRDFLPDVPLYLVGGAVRDAYLHRPINDLDLVTPQDAIRIARKLTNFFEGEIFVMDAERGVARVYVPFNDVRLTLDITQFRGVDLLEDLQGRDFTMNAMTVDLRGDLAELIDPLGGEVDLHDKRLRACNPLSLEQDPLRALRAARLSAQFGLRMDADTLAWVRAATPRLEEVSSERVRDEFFKLLGHPSAVSALKVAHRLGVLAYILPFTAQLADYAPQPPATEDGWAYTIHSLERLLSLLEGISYRRKDSTVTTFAMSMLVLQLDRFRGALNEHVAVHWANERSHHALLMLGALCQFAHHSNEQSITVLAQAVADTLKLSNPEKKRLMGMLGFYERMLFLDEKNILEVHRFWHQADVAGIDAAFLAAVHYLSTHGTFLDQHEWLMFVEKVVVVFTAYFQEYERVVAPPPLVNGNDLMNALQTNAGRMIGYLLDEIRERQVLGEITTVQQALDFARWYVEQNA